MDELEGVSFKITNVATFSELSFIMITYNVIQNLSYPQDYNRARKKAFNVLLPSIVATPIENSIARQSCGVVNFCRYRVRISEQIVDSHSDSQHYCIKKKEVQRVFDIPNQYKLWYPYPSQSAGKWMDFVASFSDSTTWIVVSSKE